MSLNFKLLGLSNSTLVALKKRGFEEATDIQVEVIKTLLQTSSNILGQSQTGTGKTAAFAIPLVETIKYWEPQIQALVITPTRELAFQIASEINSLKGHKKINVLPIYGGQSFQEQLKKIKAGVHVIVATPGRLIDHLQQGSFKLEQLKYLILDEADEMLNMGFIEDIEKILSYTNTDKQILMFSATVPIELKTIINRYMPYYKHIVIKSFEITNNLVEQKYLEVNEYDKLEVLCRIIDYNENFYGIVFCRTKIDVEDISGKLMRRGFRADGLQGDTSQQYREKVLNKFKNKEINILVATDIAARGIDINDLTHVINFSLPQNPDSYVHRIGRTGRAGKTGIAITFVSPKEYRRMLTIKKAINSNLEKDKIPAIQDVISGKINKMKSNIHKILESESYSNYLSLAQSLIDENSGSMVSLVASILKNNHNDNFDINSYDDIEEINTDVTVDVRMFFARGYKDGFTPAKLIDCIGNKVQIEKVLITDVVVLKDFSFFSTPFEFSQYIIDYFEKNKKGRPLVKLALKNKNY